MIMSIHMLEEPDRIAALRSALRVLKPGGRLAIVDFAGPATSRASWIARHGPHGRFDLGALGAPLSQVGFGAVAIRPIDWIDLQLLIGRK
jgi:SAM-dependent methyltransferase